jgi:type VI secretion system protein ImpE
MAANISEVASYLAEGKLADALAAANAGVKAAPTDFAARILLAELLLLSGNLERADVILDAAATLEPGAIIVVSEFRQLLRAETARRQLYRDGRVPEFLHDPEPADRAALAALVAWRAGDAGLAQEEAEKAESLRPRAPGLNSETPFDDFRDADDFHPSHIEVLTTTGKYFWVPISKIEQMQFHPVKRARDLAWRRCSMSVKAGPDGDVYVPANYFAEGESDDAHRLGRATSWSDEPGPVRGRGQRLFLIGEQDAGIMELRTITFSN